MASFWDLQAPDLHDQLGNTVDKIADGRSFRELVDNALVGIVDNTLDGTIIYANQAAARMVELDSPTQIQKVGSVLLWRHPERRAAFLAELQENGFVNNYEIEFITRSGNSIHTLSSATLHGNIISNMLVDITKLKCTEKALRKKQEQLIMAEQVAQMGFLSCDLETFDIWLSDGARAVFGLDEEGPINLNLIMTCVHPDDRDRVIENFNKAIGGAYEYDIDHRLVRPDGQVVWVHGRGDLQRNATGQPISMIGTVVDISKRKAAEEKLLTRGR